MIEDICVVRSTGLVGDASGFGTGVFTSLVFLVVEFICCVNGVVWFVFDADGMAEFTRPVDGAVDLIRFVDREFI